MYEVLIEVDVNGVDREQDLQTLHEQKLALALEQLPGFQSGTWVTGDQAGRGLSLTLWDTWENAQSMAERFVLGSKPAARASVVRCELRWVRDTAWAESRGASGRHSWEHPVPLRTSLEAEHDHPAEPSPKARDRGSRRRHGHLLM